jgi:hypothetical protein
MFVGNISKTLCPLQNHPKYLNGELTEEELYMKFLEKFETNKLCGDKVPIILLMSFHWQIRVFDP